MLFRCFFSGCSGLYGLLLFCRGVRPPGYDLHWVIKKEENPVMTRSSTCSLILVAAACLYAHAALAETLDFTAEHLLEAPMDARYLAFPQIPASTTASETRLQPGYSYLSAGVMDVSVPMISAQHYQPLHGGWGLLFSGFYSRLSFSGSGGSATEEVTFVKSPRFDGVFDVDVNSVSGSGNHYGASAAITHASSGGRSWQAGVAVERLDVSEFAVDFDSAGFSGRLDYAGQYNMITPYGSLQWLRSGNGGFYHTARVIAAWPLPREGFKGRISGDNLDLSGDTSSAGFGSHIPDPYLGFGYTLEHKNSGWRVDLGATLNFLALESVVHKGIDLPVYLNVSFKLN